MKLESLEDRALLAGVVEYPITSGPSGPQEITSGPDGALWFTENGANKIGRISTSGVVTEFTIPTANSKPWGITAGSDGALWFTENGTNKIGRLTTSGTFTEYSIPTSGSQPQGITAGPDNALWFTESNSGKIGRVTTSGAFSEFSTSSAGSGPFEITSGPDNALWFTETNASSIGRISTSGTINEYSTPTNNGKPQGITSGPDGALWFTENKGLIGRITTSGAITEYSNLPSGGHPYDITAGSDGALWFTINNKGEIGRITTSGSVSTYATSKNDVKPTGIVGGPDHAIWFNENQANKVGQIAVSASPTVLTVDTTSDVSDGDVSSISALLAAKGTDGRISLREAIQAADNTAATGTPVFINFNIPGSGVQTIHPASPLPTLSRPILVDATTQPGYSGTPLIQLNGEGTGTGTNGFVVYAASTTIQGFAIYGFLGNAIQLDNIDSPVVRANYLGLHADGTVGPPDGCGLVLTGTTNAVIGGETSSDRNIISGNNYGGIRIEAGASGNTIVGNFIGTSVAGTAPLGNGLYGIYIVSSPSNIIGDPSTNVGNVISGNNGPGIIIEGSSATGNTIVANAIGTTLGLNSSLGNSGDGIDIKGVAGTIIGSNTAGNHIASNNGAGIALLNGASGTFIQGNVIGGIPGQLFVDGNSGDGILIAQSSNGNVVGGTAAGVGNVVYDNSGAGVNVFSGNGNAILGNSIYANDELGIDLNGDGVTHNSGAFASGRPNSLMNFPVFNNVTLSTNTLTVSGYVGKSSLHAAFAGSRVELFKASRDSSGYGQGKVFLGDLIADSSGNFSGSIAVNNLATGDYLTATATDTNNGTSEFSADVKVTAAVDFTGSSGTYTSVYGQTLNLSINVSGYLGPATGTVNFLANNTVLAVVTLVNGSAGYTTSSLHTGTYVLRAHYNGDANYAPSDSNSYTNIITAAPLTVTAVNVDKVYGALLPSLLYTYSGLVNNDTASVFSGSLSTTATASQGVGAYPINQGSLSAGPDYSISFNQGTLTINPAVLTVTARHLTKLYGEAVPALTYTDSGLVNGDTPTVITGSLSTAATPGSSVGSYPIVQGTLTASSNYTISFTTGVLTVNPAPLIINADDQTHRYGDATAPLTYSYSGLVNGDTSTVISGSLNTTANTDAGRYPIVQGTLTAGPNYLIAYQPGTLTITPVPLAVTANDASRAYGLENPSFSAKETGLVNGDTPASLGGTLRFETNASAESAPGLYGITPNGLISTNYTISYVPGTLSVEPPTLTATGTAIAAREDVEYSGVVAGFRSTDPPVDPERFDATIQWGDGHVSSGLIRFDPEQHAYIVSGLNTYRAKGVYAVEVVVKAAGSTFATAKSIAVVLGTQPVVTGSLFTAIAGEAFSGAVATVIDGTSSSSSTDFQAMIEWGDGTVTPGQVVSDGLGAYQAVGSHTYLEPGAYQVAVTVFGQEIDPASVNYEVEVAAASAKETAGSKPTASEVKSVTLVGTSNPVVFIPDSNVTATPSPSHLADRTSLNGAELGAGVIGLPRGVFVTIPNAPHPPAASFVPIPATPGESAMASTAVNVSMKGPALGVLQDPFRLAIDAVEKQIDQWFGPNTRVGALLNKWVSTNSGKNFEARSTLPLSLPSRFFWDRLDAFNKEVSSRELPRQASEILGAGVVAYAGYVFLNTRVGYALLSLLTAKPLWSQVDPLAVLIDWENGQKRGSRSADDEETLQSLIEGSQSRQRDEENDQDDSHQPWTDQLIRQPFIRRPRAWAFSRYRNRRTQRTQGPL